ncbi:AmmeMemoRadiSam system protein A [Calderihabitans maritimus]|uniref:AMMECR1 domain-containing protein n=1 Tax=Calderihabitans maritimus TaxID=1246530 RepID=A0A1Z5HMX5_9FIRM|nr:AmmeMemoRadiSam system protein A [Calderihabitans maritimus]GAW90869.1 AMMECR1 domain-containing protein [Calderihabitans maritimus]
MGRLVYSCIAPHPPLMVPEVGGRSTEKVQNTIRAMRKVAQRLVDADPQAVVFFTPHGPMFQDAISILTAAKLEGDLGEFGAPQVRFNCTNDLELVDCIIRLSRQRGIPIVSLDDRSARQYQADVRLDHGILVPLYYLKEAGLTVPIVAITMGLLPREDLFAFGVALQEGIKEAGKRVALVASGDLSHRLLPGAPAGYNPKGTEFDEYIKEALEKFDVKAIVQVPENLAESAGECGLRTIIMLLGALDGFQVSSRVYSYEGPYGVGYLVAELIPEQRQGSKKLVERLYEERKNYIAEIRKKESPLVRLARESLENYIRHGRIIEPPTDLSEEMRERAGVFVSIKKHGMLRGCIGTIVPTRENVAEEVIHNAIKAGVEDPRFSPVTLEELPELVYSVDVLKPPEPVSGMEELDPQRYGVIVRSGSKSGLLLPNLEGIDTVEEQVEIAKRKAGIFPGEKFEMERFEVIRHT